MELMLTNLKLKNFRNQKNYELKLSEITVLIGQNGAGKTNILEACVILSFCRSFRDDNKRSLINFDSEYCRVTGDNLEVFITKTPRLLMKTKEKGVTRKISDFVGLMPCVIFSPETISIITGAPADRRRFLDIMICQEDREYLIALAEFKKIRQQRNSLLQRIGHNEAEESELNFWDREFVTLSKIIFEKREEVTNFLNKYLTEIYGKISGNLKDIFSLKYHRNFEGDLKENLKRIRGREIAYGGSILGPHRDDLEFILNKNNMANFASRGELKSAILALKIAELKSLENSKKSKSKFGENEVKPIVLLDDIFSEFDAERRSHLSKLILQYQTLITATEESHLPSELLKRAKVVKLDCK